MIAGTKPAPAAQPLPPGSAPNSAVVQQLPARPTGAPAEPPTARGFRVHLRRPGARRGTAIATECRPRRGAARRSAGRGGGRSQRTGRGRRRWALSGCGRSSRAVPPGARHGGAERRAAARLLRGSGRGQPSATAEARRDVLQRGGRLRQQDVGFPLARRRRSVPWLRDPVRRQQQPRAAAAAALSGGRHRGRDVRRLPAGACVGMAGRPAPSRAVGGALRGDRGRPARRRRGSACPRSGATTRAGSDRAPCCGREAASDGSSERMAPAGGGSRRRGARRRGAAHGRARRRHAERRKMSNPGKRSGPRGTVRGSGRGVPGSCRPAAGAEEPGTAARPGWELSAALGERSAAPGLYGPEPRPPATHRGFGRGALRWRRPRVTRCDPALRLCAFVCPAAPPRPAHKAALRAQRRRLRSPRLPEPRNAPQCPAPHPAPGALRGGGGRRRSSGCCRRSVWERSANRRLRCCRRGFPAPIAGASEQK